MAGLLLCWWKEVLKWGGVSDGLPRPPNLDHKFVEVLNPLIPKSANNAHNATTLSILDRFQ